MIKKILIGIAFAVIALVIVLILFIKKDESTRAINIAEAVPGSAMIYIEKLDYDYFISNYNETSVIWHDLLGLFAENESDSILDMYDDFLKKFELLYSVIEDGGLNMSLHLVGNDKIVPVYYLLLSKETNKSSLENEIKSGLQSNFSVKERKYETKSLFELSGEIFGEMRSYSFSIVDGIFMISSSSILVEEAIRGLNAGGGISNQEDFRRVRDIAGKYSFGNVYINYPEIRKLTFPFLNTAKNYTIDFISQIASWGEFDLDMKDNSVVLNGMSSVSDSIPSWLHLFEGQSPVRIESASLVPSNATDFLTIGISNTVLFEKNFRKLLLDLELYHNFNKSDQHYQDVLGESPFSGLLDLLNEELIFFNMQGKTSDEFNKVVICKVKSRSETFETFHRWISVFAESKQSDAEDYVHVYRLDNQTRYNIYEFPFDLYDGSIPGMIFQKYFVLFDNMLIMSDSYDAVKRTIYQNVLKKTMINEQSFESVNNLISSKSNISYVIMPEHFLDRNLNIFKRNIIDRIEHSREALKTIPGIVIQFAQDDEVSFSNISLCYSSIFNHRAQTVWESLLDTAAIVKPQLVTNHNTLEKEILIQDAKNNLYLINGTGRILWELELDGPILGELYQIDFYKNKKLQYLFNTRTKIYLLDRNGNNVEDYPVKLRSNATNGLALFDYDKNHNYRVFIAAEDRKIYLYDIFGNIISGWNFDKTEGIVTNTLKHFRVGKKDYIVFSDEIRPYFLDRRGRERVNIQSRITVSKKNTFQLDMNIAENRPRFVTTDTAGNVFGIDTEGRVSKLLENNLSSGHYFKMADFNNDGLPDYLFVDNIELKVVANNGDKLFSYKFKSEITSEPDIYEFSSSDFKIGLTDNTKNLIYLVNPDGSLYEGFPLEGSTRFSIGYFAGSDSRFNLIVGSNNGFLYNYSIE